MLDNSSVIHRVGRARVSYTRRVGGAIAYKSIYIYGGGTYADNR